MQVMIRVHHCKTSRFRTCPWVWPPPTIHGKNRAHPFSGNPVMQLPTSIFKAYDIRGIVPVTIDQAVAEALGRAFGTAARREGETTVAVGRDGRLSGATLSGALIRGLVAAGLEVIDIGTVTTPMV